MGQNVFAKKRKSKTVSKSNYKFAQNAVHIIWGAVTVARCQLAWGSTNYHICSYSHAEYPQILCPDILLIRADLRFYLHEKYPCFCCTRRIPPDANKCRK